MARRFRRTRRGITAAFEPGEAGLVAGLFEDVARMLGGEAVAGDEEGGAAAGGPEGTAGSVGREDASSEAVAEIAALERMLGDDRPVAAPTDAALARLLPTGSRDDDEAAADFRRFTQAGLADRKRSGLLAAAGTLRREAPFLLTDDEARAWLTAMTDVRLVVAERLGLRTDEDAEQVGGRADAGEPEAWLAGVYDFLTWLQEGLADVLLRDLPAGGGPPRR